MEELGDSHPAPPGSLARSRGIGRGIVWISGVYLGVGVAGTWVALRDGLVGRPFGWDLGSSPVSSFIFGLGTALSAPLILLLALVVANFLLGRGGTIGRRAAGVIGMLGAGFFIGMLAEPVTWDVRTWSPPSVRALLVTANLVLPVILTILALRIRARASESGPFRGPILIRQGRVSR